MKHFKNFLILTLVFTLGLLASYVNSPRAHAGAVTSVKWGASSYSSAASSSNVAAVAGATNLYGFAIRETAGSTAVVKIHAGTDASGPLLVPVSVGANASAGDYFTGGVDASGGGGGIYIERVSGTTDVVIYYSAF